MIGCNILPPGIYVLSQVEKVFYFDGEELQFKLYDNSVYYNKYVKNIYSENRYTAIPGELKYDKHNSIIKSIAPITTTQHTQVYNKIGIIAQAYSESAKLYDPVGNIYKGNIKPYIPHVRIASFDTYRDYNKYYDNTPFPGYITIGTVSRGTYDTENKTSPTIFIVDIEGYQQNEGVKGYNSVGQFVDTPKVEGTTGFPYFLQNIKLRLKTMKTNFSCNLQKIQDRPSIVLNDETVINTISLDISKYVCARTAETVLVSPDYDALHNLHYSGVQQSIVWNPETTNTNTITGVFTLHQHVYVGKTNVPNQGSHHYSLCAVSRLVEITINIDEKDPSIINMSADILESTDDSIYETILVDVNNKHISKEGKILSPYQHVTASGSLAESKALTQKATSPYTCYSYTYNKDFNSNIAINLNSTLPIQVYTTTPFVLAAGYVDGQLNIVRCTYTVYTPELTHNLQGTSSLVETYAATDCTKELTWTYVENNSEVSTSDVNKSYMLCKIEDTYNILFENKIREEQGYTFTQSSTLHKTKSVDPDCTYDYTSTYSSNTISKGIVRIHNIEFKLIDPSKRLYVYTLQGTEFMPPSGSVTAVPKGISQCGIYSGYDRHKAINTNVAYYHERYVVRKGTTVYKSPMVSKNINEVLYLSTAVDFTYPLFPTEVVTEVTNSTFSEHVNNDTFYHTSSTDRNVIGYKGGGAEDNIFIDVPINALPYIDLPKTSLYYQGLAATCYSLLLKYIELYDKTSYTLHGEGVLPWNTQLLEVIGTIIYPVYVKKYLQSSYSDYMLELHEEIENFNLKYIYNDNVITINNTQELNNFYGGGDSPGDTQRTFGV